MATSPPYHHATAKMAALQARVVGRLCPYCPQSKVPKCLTRPSTSSNTLRCRRSGCLEAHGRFNRTSSSGADHGKGMNDPVQRGRTDRTASPGIMGVPKLVDVLGLRGL